MTDRYEVFQHSDQSATEETATKLSERARRLLEQGMRPTVSRKRKWATGKEKWEALQREGAIAAGVINPHEKKRGRPAGSTGSSTPGEVEVFLAVVQLVQRAIVSGERDFMFEARVSQIRNDMVRLGDELTEMDKMLAEIVLGQL